MEHFTRLDQLHASFGGREINAPAGALCDAIADWFAAAGFNPSYIYTRISHRVGPLDAARDIELIAVERHKLAVASFPVMLGGTDTKRTYTVKADHATVCVHGSDDITVEAALGAEGLDAAAPVRVSIGGHAHVIPAGLVAELLD